MSNRVFSLVVCALIATGVGFVSAQSVVSGAGINKSRKG